ncbi:von Willebrand factor A domain-containing protein 7-like [Engraulis encrasicolus]|uniref:von Willebrand factor A domain-containing protein 7-like n=1 Tax=Engraulis encrasicolus TaxID=184585 RepID=UPI002FD48C7B
MVNLLSALRVALLMLALFGVAQAFMPVGGGTQTHTTITGTAVLSKVKEACQAVAESEGREFKPTGSSAEELLRACLGTATGEVSAAKFHTALNQIYMQNGLVDRELARSPAHHFNNEAFVQSRSIITEGTVSVKANVRNGNFQTARETLGRVCHTLQDFYSHSNWVDLGYKSPYTTLLRPDLPIDNVADIDTPTCSDCASGTCPNPLLPDILEKKKLTSGYLGLESATKPKGKCSHGGASDLTSAVEPRGGLSKDERRSDNGALHDAAVAVATQATLDLLEDIRGAAGNKEFLRLMGIARSAVLCFVIDTTGSMADDIAEAKRVATQIIDTKKGTVDEPSEYILVPFNDPKFGPLVRTTDPDVMKAKIAGLGADGGGDLPEMCLSGLQLALTGAPPSSQIYIFTDAAAKDMHLEKTIISLIRSTKSTVNIFMTPKKTRSESKRSLKYTARAPDFRVYYDLALASGGSAIEVSKSNLPQATEIIVDTSTSALVTIMQRSRSKAETFSFLLDESISNVTLYVTGNSITFTLKSPTGVTQSSSQTSGPLGEVKTVGNLKRIRLNAVNQTGLWEIQMKSSSSYTVKVTGQSAITFVYDFVETFKGPHPGYAVIEGRPESGMPTMLLLTLSSAKGPGQLKVTEAALLEVSGSGVANGTVEHMGEGNYLVSVESAPAGEFVVLLKGQDTVTSSLFQRQSTTQMAVTPLTIKVVADKNMEPGKQFDVPFTIHSSVPSTKFNIRARNDKDFAMNVPSSVTPVGGSTAEGVLKITSPANTASGTDVTLTIDVESASGASDSNYVVVRLSVVKKVTDFTPPLCTVVNVNNSCPANCSEALWMATVSITDGNGTGVENIWLQQGQMDLVSTNETEADGVTVLFNSYQVACCTPDLQLTVTDKEGNVGSCFHSIRPPTTTPIPLTTPHGGQPSLGLAAPLWLCLLLSATAVLRDITPFSL